MHSWFVSLLLLFWPFNCKRPKQRRFEHENIKKNKSGSQPGLAGPVGSRVDPVWPGQFLTCFLRRPGPATGQGRPAGRGPVLKHCLWVSNFSPQESFFTLGRAGSNVVKYQTKAACTLSATKPNTHEFFIFVNKRSSFFSFGFVFTRLGSHLLIHCTWFS